MDIIFYDLQFNRLHILPPTSKSVGYISANCEKYYNDIGSFQILFWDAELEEKIKKYQNEIIIKYGDFWGYLTDYQFTDYSKRIFGKSLNALAHRIVIPSGEFNDTISNILNLPSWLTFDTTFNPAAEYTAEKYQQADDFLINLCTKYNYGWEIYTQNKQYILRVYEQSQNNLILSENNLNAYEFEENFDNKDLAFGGWYEKVTEVNGEETKTWTYYAEMEKTGVYKRDVVLSANTEEDAKEELKKYKVDHTLTAKTKNLTYNVDYKIGDIVRVQKGSVTEKKLVNGITIWHEGNEYHEEPKLTELEA